MYRLLNLEYDKFNKDTEALMGAELAKFTGTPSKNLGELKRRLVNFHVAIVKYEDKVGKKPDNSLIGSTLTNMLDSDTKRSCINEGGQLGDYQEDAISHLTTRLRAQQ